MARPAFRGRMRPRPPMPIWRPRAFKAGGWQRLLLYLRPCAVKLRGLFRKESGDEGISRIGCRAGLGRIGSDGVGADSARHNEHAGDQGRSEEHTSELQSLMRISYAVFCLKKNTT